MLAKKFKKKFELTLILATNVFIAATGKATFLAKKPRKIFNISKSTAFVSFPLLDSML